MSGPREQYFEALKQRRRGIPSEFGRWATFLEIKPQYYADARILSEDALRVFEGFKTTHPPYGLVDRNGQTIKTVKGDRNPWMVLSGALRTTAHASFDLVSPTIPSCPYHEVLSEKLLPSRTPLRPYDNDEQGLDTLRVVTAPGAELNAPLFASLLLRMPGLQQLHGSTSDLEGFARRSSVLLREPLSHPQQWAVGFVYSLGGLIDLLSPNYLHDFYAVQYTKVEDTPNGDRLNWKIPTEDFTLKWEIDVPSRVEGSEYDRSGDHITHYSVGTRLGDIKIDEPRLGCPGNLFAEAMWQRGVDVAIGEKLW